MICHPSNKDISQMKAIWKECFDDTDENIECFFDNCFSYESCYISKNGETVESCLHMIDCFVSDLGKSIKAKYMYAVCTKPEFRNKGIMTSLIKSACDAEKAKGTDVILCVPSEEWLFGFYKKLGFSDGIYCSTIKMSREEVEKNASECEYSLNAEPKLFNGKRNVFLSSNSFIRFPDYYIALTDVSSYSTAFNDSFYCIFYKDGDFVKVADCFFKDERGKREMLYCLSNETDAKSYEIDYCSNNNTCLKGVVKILSEQTVISNRIYLGIKME